MSVFSLSPVICSSFLTSFFCLLSLLIPSSSHASLSPSLPTSLSFLHHSLLSPILPLSFPYSALPPSAAVHSLKLSRAHVDWHSVDEVYLYSDATTSKIARTVTQKLGFSKG